jgi:uncharacterized repeat protein (TIGR01451 family)
VKAFSSLRIVAGLIVALALAGARADAQGFGLSVSNSASSILVSNSLTYTINVTNLTGLSLAGAFVTNLLPASVQFVNATQNQGVFSTNNSGVVFSLGPFPGGGIALLSLTVLPTATGSTTNSVTVAATAITNTASTNVVVQVTNIVIQADLGVTMTGSAQPVITNDWMFYQVTVTDAGPNAAPGVMLTNTLPPGVILEAVSPASQPFTTAGSNLIFNLGTIPNGGSATLGFTVEPTNAGVLTFSASVGSAAVLDTNTANNSASTNVTVLVYPPGTLTATTSSAQTLDLQNGLTEQTILLSNTGGTDVAAARVVVTGLAKRLFNAVGTNNGNPFVAYGTTLPAGKSVTLLLQFSPRGSFPFANSQLQAFPAPLPNLTPPVASTNGTVAISRMVMLANGDLLIEFPSIPGRTYTVVYSGNSLFTNAMVAPPSFVAPANETQWIDYGPPETVSPPATAGARFYRVFLNP